jgi:hypothetical protein
MKKQFLLILAIIASICPIFPQDDTPAFGEWEISVFLGCYSDCTDPVPEFKPQLTDSLQNPYYPIIFLLPDKNDPTINITIDQYVKTYGNYKFRDFIIKAIPAYLKAMFVSNIPAVGLYANVVIKIVDNPDDADGLWKIAKPHDFPNYFGYDQIEWMVQDAFGDEYWESINDRTNLKSSMILLNCGTPDGNSGTPVQIAFNPNALDQATKIIAHELGHFLYGFKDNGIHQGVNPFFGILNGEKMGATKDTSPYDMMHTGKSTGFSPFNLYGLTPYNTNDLLNVYENVFLPLYINEETNGESNKHSIKIKSMREKLISADGQLGVKKTIILPINTDISETSDLYVENQRFLIEYRNGKGFDNVSAMYRENQSKGILISHIINDKSFGRITDIENTQPFPEGARNPDFAWDNPLWSGHETLGMWYFGKKINDWMDDIAQSTYPMEGGKGTWWKVPGASFGESLPSDFFYDEPGRNAFTPSTRPNTRSWKDNETNIAVFIDKIDGDYADLTIYRNYHSTPLTATTAKTLPDGTKGLTISGDGYIGENFSVGGGTRLSLGDGTAGQVTLIPNTNMLVKSTGHLMLREEGRLILENSSLNFIDGSIFSPYDDAHIELNNSGINFELGSIIDYGPYNLNFDNYNLSISGASSFFNSNLDMIGASVLTVNESSVFTLKSGTNLIMSPSSTFTLKAGSTLRLEDGVNLVFMDGASLIFEEGSRIVIEGNAKITGKIAQSYSRIALTDNSRLTVGAGSIINIKYIPVSSLILRGNSELVIESGAVLNIEPTTKTDCSVGSKITVQGSGTLNASETSFLGADTWQGIVAEIGSNIRLTNTAVNNAVWGLNATAANVIVYHSSFSGCENGVKLVNCTGYTLNDNYFNGKGTGVGISLTEVSSELIKKNQIQNHGTGLVLITCSPKLVENVIHDNNHYGVYVIGYTSKPLMINTSTSTLDLNNEIKNNGSDYFDQCSQIYLRYKANIYMEQGRNNVYSEPAGSIPTYPCILTESDMAPSVQLKSVDPYVYWIRIDAKNNYWGYDNIENNFESFFDLYERYGVSYIEYATVPFEEGLPGPAIYSTLTNDGKDLIKAIQAEEDGKIDLAIKRLEKIVDNNIELTDSLLSEEYYIALALLPDLYVKQQIALDPLVKIYDANLAEDETANKKFYKQMKVTSSIKSKKYDEAITTAEEMKLEAESEGEVMLADIEIEIAKMMKDAQNNGKTILSGTSLSALIDDLTGEEKIEIETPADITEEVVLPKENILYQNYPNPFNPVTQIKFDLAKSSNVRLSVYNVNGQVVAELASGVMNAGNHAVDFDGSRFNSGIYYYTLEVDGRNITKKMILTK